MRTLGIVRRMDDLGRVVIPKEVRNKQGWKTGEVLELFLDENKLVIQSFEDARERQGSLNT